MQKTRIVGTQGSGAKEVEQHVHPFSTAGGNHSGALVLSERFLHFNPEFRPFSNDDFGTAMNQTVTFGGTRLNATVVHAGINSGSAASGTTDGDAAGQLRNVGGGFDATVGPGALVHNTTDGTFAIVQTVTSDDILTLTPNVLNGSEIMDNGENYVINDIWVGTAVQGTWNFADGGEVSITSANNSDEATFTVDSSHLWPMTDFVSFTGKIDLAIYNVANNSIILEFGLNGTIVGNSVNLNDFIDPGDFAAQTFVIPKVEFGLSTQNINSMRITITRVGGTKPTMAFDNLQWENTGTPIVYKATTPLNSRFHISELRIRIEDAISAVLTDGSMPNIDPSAILGVSELTNGVVFASVKKGKTVFSATLKNLGDFFAVGLSLTDVTGDATNTGLTLSITFREPIVLEGGETENFLSFTINDTMTNLTRFTAVARGGLELQE